MKSIPYEEPDTCSLSVRSAGRWLHWQARAEMTIEHCLEKYYGWYVESMFSETTPDGFIGRVTLKRVLTLKIGGQK